jgi:hypothetical protein
MSAACAIALDWESCQFRLYGMIFVLVECNETYLPGLRIFAEQFVRRSTVEKSLVVQRQSRACCMIAELDICPRLR